MVRLILYHYERKNVLVWPLPWQSNRTW